MVDFSEVSNRRVLKVRSQPWVHWLAFKAAGLGMNADQISLFGLLASFGAIFPVIYSDQWPLFWLVYAFCIQVRLLANLLDGMVAIEQECKTYLGPLFNELPDRIEDSLFLILAGYSCGQTSLGLLCALLACVTAYIRTLGGSFGFVQNFCGPAAKQQRMAVLTAGAIISALFTNVMAPTLMIIGALTLVTIVRRVYALAQLLKGQTND